MSNRRLSVEKLGKPILLDFDGHNLRIEGDSDNKKRGKHTSFCF